MEFLMTIEMLENGAEQYVTEGGVTVQRTRHDTPYEGAIERYIDGLNSRRGAVFSSNYEYPGRYTRWDTAIIDPPVAISARGRSVRIEALNKRGEIMTSPFPRGRQARANLYRRGAQPRPVGVQRVEANRGTVQDVGRCRSRPVRRLRL
jgi:anthranilate synthase